MTDIKVVIVGASGRMGQTLVAQVSAATGVTLCAALEHENSPHLGQDAGAVSGLPELGVPITCDVLEAFADADAVLDFTTPQASVEFVAVSAQARLVHVVGTTGFSKQEQEKIQAAARHATIIQSGNMSLGVNLLSGLVQIAASSLDASFDIEVLEMHHKRKVDAPSGTAFLLGAAAAKGRNISLEENSTRVRDGHTGARAEGSIGFATLRGGSIVGEHSVIFAGEGERLCLAHHAEDRSIFAHGALEALLWGVRKKKPGLYTMMDVLGLSF